MRRHRRRFCGQSRPAVLADAAPIRAFWRLLFATEHLSGKRVARAVAALVLRVAARRPGSYVRTAHRVSPRLRHENPDLTKIPDRWHREHPTVQVHRLGLRLDLDLRDNLQAILFYTGTYEPAFRQHLLHGLKRDDVVVDIGAHIGVHALPAARRLRQLGGGTVLAFEPASDSMDRMIAAAAHNDVDVTVVQAACSNRSGRRVLNADPRYPPADAGVRSFHAHGPAVGEVRTVRFDDWVITSPEGRALTRLDVVKLDVEGHEASALDGMRSSLARWRPRAVYVEIKDATPGCGTNSEALLRALLADMGYRTTGERFDHNELFVTDPSTTAPPVDGTGPAPSDRVDVP